jgi:mono/diheme cytochrome c family protein
VTFAAAALAAAVLALPAAAADAARGKDLSEKWCGACHSVGDNPRQADAGPLFTDLAKKDQAEIETGMTKPHDFMPDFPKLTDDDRADIVAYIVSLR